MIGQSLGHYRILEKLGAGGMGVVYKAHDTRLGRDVAIKVLPDAFARDPERLARFEREAHVLASLNHPNIAAIYGLEQEGDVRYLVLEYVPGETLAEQLKRGPEPVEEAVRVGRQITDALSDAHAKGVMHRDLKPANVKITPEGKVKVLDFGLAKAFHGDVAPVDSSQSPTLSAAPTREGMILGTPAYMSPEQARARPLDKRTDVWSFGCVLYEMLAGCAAFRGDSVSDVLSAVLRTEPDWSALPAETPPNISLLLRRCLRKDPDQRLHDVADARLEMEEAPLPAPAVAAPKASRGRPLLWAVAGLLVGALAVLIALRPWTRPAAPGRAVTRWVIKLPPGEAIPGARSSPLGIVRPSVAISPDGGRLAYVIERKGTVQLHLRSMDQFEATAVPGTEGAYYPFFSPDGRWVGFFSGNKLKKVAVAGGAPETLCDATYPYGASWGPDDTIVFSDREGVDIVRVPASGGSPQRVAFRDPQKGAARYFWPEFLPGGKAALLSPASGVTVLSLATGEERVLLPSAGNARFAATVSDLAGHVVFARGASLWALPFDVSKLQATGSPVQMLDGLKTEYRGSQHFALSRNGTLAYVPGTAGAGASASLVWVDRQGKVNPLGLPKRTFGNFRVSPDGKRVAVAIQGVTSDIWIHDLARGTLVRLTTEGNNSFPVWTPDSRRIVFSSSKGGPASLFSMPADGSGEAELLASSGRSPRPDSISPDGQVLLYGEEQPGSGMDVGMVRLKSDRKPEPFLRTRFAEWGPAFSPDGRWVAYTSDESGQYEIYVRPFPGPGAKIQVSTGGGEEPVWAASGRELCYRIGTKWMAVAVQTNPEFTAGAPRLLFEGPYLNIPGVSYDVAPDGRFLLIQPAEPEAEATQINVVLNWFDELRRRAPVGKN